MATRSKLIESTGHTPGPWRVGGQYPHHLVFGGDKDIVMNIVADCYTDRAASAWTPIEQIANARLIAAAPDLLAACGSAIWVFNNLHNVRADPERFIKFGEAALKDLRAALDKAEGRD